MRWLFVVTFGWALLGCGPAAGKFITSVPDSIPSDWSVFVALIDESKESRLWALDGQSSVSAFDEEAGENVEIYVIATPMRLDRLVETPGEQRRGSNATGDTFGLLDLSPATHEAFVRVLRNSDFDESWQPLSLEMLPDDLQTLRVAASPLNRACKTFEETTINLGEPSSDTRGALAVAVDEQSALVSSDRGPFYLVTAEGGQVLDALEPSLPKEAGFRDEDGILWLFGVNGSAARVDPSDWSHEVLPSMPGFAKIRWVDGVGAGDELIIYVMDDGGRIARFDGQTWSPRLADLDGSFNSDISMIGPNEIIAVTADSPRVFRLRDGQLSEEVYDADQIENLGATAHVPGLGSFIATEGRGFAYLQPEGESEWQQIPLNSDRSSERQGLTVRAYSMAETAAGVMIVGAGGGRTEYLRGEGFCPLPGNDERTTFETLSRIIRVGGDFVVLSDKVDAVARATYLKSKL